MATSETVANIHGKPEGRFTFTSHDPGESSLYHFSGVNLAHNVLDPITPPPLSVSLLRAGDHTICIRTNSTSGFFSTTHIKFYLDITVGSSKKDPSADNTHLTTLASKLRDLNDKVDSIKLEQQYQREIEAVFRDASEQTNSRAVWWILAQMVVLAGMAFWQRAHLKVSIG